MKRVGALTVVTLAMLGIIAEAGAPQSGRADDRLSLGVVAVEATVGGDVVKASGTVIDAEQGLVLTSATAVWGATSLKLSTGLGIVHGRIVARAACDGLALVETQPRIPGLVSPADRPATTPQPTGALLTTYGRRLAREDALLAVPARIERPPLKLDAALVPEAAGGPVLDAQGQLVGIATSERILSWPTVQQRLDQLVPGPRRVYAGWRDQYDCAARLNRATHAAHPRFKTADARLVIPVPASRIPGAEVDG